MHIDQRAAWLDPLPTDVVENEVRARLPNYDGIGVRRVSRSHGSRNQW